MSEGSEIVRVAARGDGITADGRAVPLAAPGDRLVGEHSIVRGPHHQVPPCRHFPECGGCQLQHLDDSSWAEFITDRISGGLAAQRLEADIRPPLLSPPRTRRRAALHAERRGRQVQLGFTEERAHRIVDMAECHVLAPELFELVAPLRGLLAVLLGGRRATVHLTLIDSGVDVLIDGVEPKGLQAEEGMIAFASRHGLARLAIDSGLGPEVRWEPEPASITLSGVPVSFPPASFLQATREGEAALVTAVREAAGAPRTVADLFAGLGTFSFAFPEARVYAAEAARDAALALKAAAGAAQRQLMVEHRDLYRRPLERENADRFDAIILDPPRAGAKEQVALLAGSRAPVIAYVSCNPSSFAHDAKTLCEGGYRLDWVQSVGQFRWSTHVELAARFSR